MNLSKYKIGDIIEIKIKAKVVGLVPDMEDSPLGLAFMLSENEFTDRDWPDKECYEIVNQKPIPTRIVARDLFNIQFIRKDDPTMGTFKVTLVNQDTNGYITDVYLSSSNHGFNQVTMQSLLEDYEVYTP